MKRIKENKELIKDLSILELNNIKEYEISTFVIKNEKPFKIIVKSGDFVKIGQPILINEDGQKFLSNISGKVKDIYLKEDQKKEAIYYVLLENNFKNEEIKPTKIKVKNKENFITLLKEFGVVSKDFLLYKYFENLGETLNISAYENSYIFNNYVLLTNYEKQIKSVILKLKKLFEFKKINYFTNKLNYNNILKFKDEKDKIYKKQCKTTFLTLEDLFNIYNALNGINKTYNFITINGGAINKNCVVKMGVGVKIEDLLNFAGGFKEDINLIEGYKYNAMQAINDEFMLKQKIKKCKNKTDKEKLKKLLLEKQKEAKENIYSKVKEYHNKFLNTMSACFVCDNFSKNSIKSFKYTLQNSCSGILFLNYKQFR